MAGQWSLSPVESYVRGPATVTCAQPNHIQTYKTLFTHSE